MLNSQLVVWPRLVLISVVLTIAACSSVGPKYEKPVVDLPESWTLANVNKEAVTPVDGVRNGSWWTVFNDPVLDRLVEEALANNSNLMLAVARVEEASGTLSSVSGEQLPGIGVGVTHDRTRISERGTVPLPSSSNVENNNTRVTLNIAYEIDLWGRLRNATQAARADLLATEAARDTVRITLTADIVKAYFGLRALDEQIATTRRTIETRSNTLELQRQRFQVGDISELDFRRVEAEVATARAQLPTIELQRTQVEGALGVLLGRSPRAIYQGIMEAGSDAGARPSIVIVPSGLPSDLLLRRPDLIEAEQRMIAANARIGVARAGYFPQITLTGYYGSESVALTDLFTGPARIWQAAVGLMQPLFGGGRVRGQVEAATARERQALAQYQNTIQTAFSEVRTAIVAQTKAREQFEAEQQRVKALTDALRLARLRYDNGIASQLDVLDAERNMLIAELNRIDALRAQRAAIADLFRALGG